MNQFGLVGMRVFRCGADKRPQTRNGFKDAFPCRRVPADWPRVGFPTGAVNGIDVVDVDTKNGARGADWFWANWESLPKTRMHVTESGGYHILFRNHEGLRGSVNRIAPGVDVRADGNYVIWWAREGLPVANAEILAEWPEGLLAAALGSVLDKKERTIGKEMLQDGDGVDGVGPRPWWPSKTWDGVTAERRIKGIFDRLASMRPGQGRNAALFRYACVMREMVEEGVIDEARAKSELIQAAWMNGSVQKRGRPQCMATILSGFGMVERKFAEWRAQGNTWP